MAEPTTRIEGRGACDVAILGGGPAGASAGILLAEAGLRVTILEREHFPRFHVGESLLPLSGPLFERLGVDAALRGRGYVEKRGATFRSTCGTHGARIDFANGAGVRDPRALHVLREEFDHVLLRRAEQLGADVKHGADVVEVETGRDGCAVEYDEGPGRRARLRCDLVLDASGRGGVLARQLGLRRADAELRRAALFGQFSGVTWPDDAEPGDIVVVVRPNGGWAWLIPLPRGLTSVGCVFPSGEPARRRDETPARRLARCLAEMPYLHASFARAEAVGPSRWETDFSYSTDAYVGDRWMLLGDAAAFLDPVFSSGVQLALSAGVEASEAVLRARSGRPRARAFARYERLQRARYARFRRMVVGFERPAFRALLFRPDAWPAGARALTGVLAGVDRPAPLSRLRIAAFFLIVRLHERVPALRDSVARQLGLGAETDRDPVVG